VKKKSVSVAKSELTEYNDIADAATILVNEPVHENFVQLRKALAPRMARYAAASVAFRKKHKVQRRAMRGHRPHRKLNR
jgi:hypothetical protein